MKKQKKRIYRERGEHRRHRLYPDLFFKGKVYPEIGEQRHYEKAAVAERAIHESAYCSAEPGKYRAAAEERKHDYKAE